MAAWIFIAVFAMAAMGDGPFVSTAVSWGYGSYQLVTGEPDAGPGFQAEQVPEMEMFE